MKLMQIGENIIVAPHLHILLLKHVTLNLIAWVHPLPTHKSEIVHF
jgi:hypothetical protein